MTVLDKAHTQIRENYEHPMCSKHHSGNENKGLTTENQNLWDDCGFHLPLSMLSGTASPRLGFGTSACNDQRRFGNSGTVCFHYVRRVGTGEQAASLQHSRGPVHTGKDGHIFQGERRKSPRACPYRDRCVIGGRVETGAVSGRAHRKNPVNKGRCAIHWDGRAHRRGFTDREFRVKAKWWAVQDSNLRHPACKAGALAD